ncbi:4573_t:CDS:2 [Ambispora gerdemannii]|uniref:4573_t:CDS:1 n=1 Tax=Ambispora gerdemannii TaxID=144530 RepID=A0A9N9CR51_9GLOM|nr:4573_t:CDS:2 [Ambispora gerdemannii]
MPHNFVNFCTADQEIARLKQIIKEKDKNEKELMVRVTKLEQNMEEIKKQNRNVTNVLSVISRSSTYRGSRHWRECIQSTEFLTRCEADHSVATDH